MKISEIFKKYRWGLLASSIAVLIPSLAGILLWSKLTEAAEGSSGTSRAELVFRIFILPAVLVCLNIVAVLFTFSDKKNKDQPTAIKKLIFCIIPVLSVLISGSFFIEIFDREFDFFSSLPVITGIVMIIMGSLLPKLKRNSYVGIKIKWTLSNEENWVKTHSLASKVCIICGFITLSAIFVDDRFNLPVMIAFIIINTVIPIIYSYCLYRRQLKDGTYKESEQPDSNSGKYYTGISIIIVSAILIFCTIFIFTGNIEVVTSDNNLTVNADFYTNASIEYADIENIEYRENCEKGTRLKGMANPVLIVGLFKNNEFGSYTRYTYSGNSSCIIIQKDGETIVLNTDSRDETRNLYKYLKAKIPNNHT